MNNEYFSVNEDHRIQEHFYMFRNTTVIARCDLDAFSSNRLSYELWINGEYQGILGEGYKSGWWIYSGRYFGTGKKKGCKWFRRRCDALQWLVVAYRERYHQEAAA